MDPDVHVDKEYRDAVFRKLKLVPENQFCFDCNTKNPSWCSVILGIFICYNCATPHRSMGTHLSFVRSSELDMWTLRQLECLQIAGNKKARSFFKTHGVQGPVDYNSQIAERWRNEIFETVCEKYPKDRAESKKEVKEAREVKKEATEEKIAKDEEDKEDEKNLVAKPIQPVMPRNAFKAPAGEAKHKFRKAKVEETQAVSFKPVTFKAQAEEEEFFDPQPLKPPSRPHEALPTPTPALYPQRKEVEKKSVSSEDFEAQRIDERAHRARLAQFANASSISSDMYFGREPEVTHELTADKIKDEVSRIGSIAVEKVSQVNSS